MKKKIPHSSLRRTLLATLVAASALMGGCQNFVDHLSPEGNTPAEPIGCGIEMAPLVTTATGEVVNIGTTIKAPATTRSIIDQQTTKQLDSNFLRVDEDIDLDDPNSAGVYTFSRMWENATVLEASVISSPDNTEGIHYRAVTFNPTQAYAVHVYNDNADTLFYHTRMVGWYPKNCTLQTDNTTAVFEDYQAFVDLSAYGMGSGVYFSGLNGSVDVMMSDLREGQHWHWYPHEQRDEDETPIPLYTDSNGNTLEADGSLYRQPFGHNDFAPTYSNYFTYRHYLSAVRIYAKVDSSPQSLNTWGTINNVIFYDQPTHCVISLPEEVGEFGEVVWWGDDDSRTNQNVRREAMYGNDPNHADDNPTVTFPVSMGSSSSVEPQYLGYFLVQPDRPVRIGIQTDAGTYSTKINNTLTIDGQEMTLFEASKIYNICLNLSTDGNVDIFIENKNDEDFYILSSWNEEEQEYRMANSYVIDRSKLPLNSFDVYGLSFNAMFAGGGHQEEICHEYDTGDNAFHPTDIEIDPYSAYLVWESSPSLIWNVELVQGHVRFYVTKDGPEGNALVAVADKDGNFIWSWHLWVTDSPAEQTFNTAGGTVTLLDRNMGATAATYTSATDLLQTYGLYYQWGRKDASPGPNAYNYATQDMVATYYDGSGRLNNFVDMRIKGDGPTTLMDGVLYPADILIPTLAYSQDYYYNWMSYDNRRLWGTEDVRKSVYDPCPYGYHVVREEIADIFDYASENGGLAANMTGGYGGLNVTTADGGTAFFPFAGVKGVDRGLFDQDAAWRNVGTWGDYMGATIDTAPNEDNYDSSGNIGIEGHRRRTYITNAKTGNVSVLQGPTYPAGKYFYNDYTNRKTAASVRCMKEVAE